MMKSLPTASAVHAELANTRAQRAAALRTRAAPFDTLHLARFCRRCGELVAVVRGPGERWSGLLSAPRIESVHEAAAAAELVAREFLDAPSVAASCACRGAARDRIVIVGARFCRALVGLGAEIVLEGLREFGPVVQTGADAPAARWTWRMLRAPDGGPEHLLGDALDDAVASAAFGRGLSVVTLWREALRAAVDGASSVSPVEPGIWLYAGRAGEPEPAASIATLCAAHPGVAAHPLVLGTLRPELRAQIGEALVQEALTAGVEAGAVIDTVPLAQLIAAGLARVGFAIERDGATRTLIARDEALPWPIDVDAIAAQAPEQMLTLAELAATAVDEVSTRTNEARSFLAALSAARPGLRVAMDGLKAWPLHPDETSGRAFDLSVDPARLRPGTVEFDREVRYACDVLPAYADATRLCTCLAPAWIATRLMPWADVERMTREGKGDGPWTVDVLQLGAQPLASRVVAVCCELHTRVVARSERERLGLDEATLPRRLEEDRWRQVFSARTRVATDGAGRVALMAQGPFLGSAMFDDGLLAALHVSAGSPLPLDRAAGALVCSTGVIVLHDLEIDPVAIAALCSQGSVMDGLPLGTNTPFQLTRPMRLDAAPVGRVNVLPIPE